MTNHVISRVKKGIYPDHFGLANQLFQIATVCAYAKRNGLVAAFPDLKNTERNGSYLDTVFRNVEKGYDDIVAFCMNEGRVYYEPTFKYTEIPTGMSDFLVDGYFQSATALGYSPVTVFFKAIFPIVYPQVRLPILAVLAYATANVEIPLLLGPNNPPTLAVAVVQWFNHVDLSMRFQASSAALLQVAVTF